MSGKCLRLSAIGVTALLVGNGPPRAQTMLTPTDQIAMAETNPGIPTLVDAERDLVSKFGVDQDSWFFVCHLNSKSGVIDVLVHIIHLAPPPGAITQAIVSILDPKSGKYISEENVYPDTQVTFDRTRFHVVTPSGTMSGTPSAMQVVGDFTKAGVKVNLQFAVSGPVLVDLSNGVLPFYGDVNYEYALPSMITSGTVAVNGASYEVTGTSWFDRQWGKQNPRFWTVKHWSWMGISLENGDHISLWDINDSIVTHSFATVLHANGGIEVVAVEPLAKGATDMWTSTATGQRYPTHWHISIPSMDAALEVTPRIREQEVVSKIAPKYEGASLISGHMRGQAVRGHAVVELVGDWR